MLTTPKNSSIFQSTPPARGATGIYDLLKNALAISIHAPREGGDHPAEKIRPTKRISIHAPREGGDGDSSTHFANIAISIHAPREGGDFMSKILLGSSIFRFQSTPPARGATL